MKKYKRFGSMRQAENFISELNQRSGKFYYETIPIYVHGEKWFQVTYEYLKEDKK